MTDRELRKMNRRELLELLLESARENESLRTQLQEQETQLSRQLIDASNAGSIADAALQLSGVFQAADQAAQVYLNNIRQMEQNAAARQQQAEEQLARADAYLNSISRQLEQHGLSAEELRSRALQEVAE